MTNKEQLELIAKAREYLLEEEIEVRNDLILAIRDAREIVEVEFGVNPFKNKAMAKITRLEHQLNLVLAHKAEIDELEQEISRTGIATDGWIRAKMKERLLTKAKRLLGVE